MMIEYWHYPLLFLTGLLAGWVDSIAGGGGIITVPVLMGIGLPPIQALGTNKFQSSFGSFSSSIKYIRSGLIELKPALFGVLITAISATAGTLTVKYIGNEFLKVIIPILLLIIVVFMVIFPKLGIKKRRAVLPLYMSFLLLGLVLGFYDGFFGPGTGNFWVFGLILLRGKELVKGTAYTKIMNFTSNFMSMLVFLISGNIIFQIGIIMALGQFIGARIGAGMVLKKGAKFIRPIFLLISIMLIGNLAYEMYSGQAL